MRRDPCIRRLSTARSRAARARISCSWARCCTTSARDTRPTTRKSAPTPRRRWRARIGLDDHGTDVLVWLVRNHLLLADTATRRDLSDPATITRFARAVGDSERLDLLYALTIGDSRATGPAAWSTSKAALVRELFVKTDTLFEEGVVVSETAAVRRAELGALIGHEADEYLDAMPPAYTTAFPAEVLAAAPRADRAA